MKITAVLVDDEPYALSEMEYFLQSYPDIVIAGMYTDPHEALEKIGELKPQAVFLDINMPQLLGTDAASMILDISPGTDIVFATAYDEYAVSAFELNAVDYILKPIDEERLKKTVERLRTKAGYTRELTERKLRIKCFGGFRMYWEGCKPIKWRIDKARELFIYLLQNHNRRTSKDELLDALWPDEHPDKAVKLLYNGIYYIRKALEDYGVSSVQISMDASYRLELGAVEWDVRRFYKLTERAGGQAASLEEVETIYTGEYLQGHFYSWADAERNRLAKAFEKHGIELARKYFREKNYAKAEALLTRAYEMNPYNEEITELLLNIYNATGQKINAAKHFREYARLLDKELGIEPPAKLRELSKL